MICCGTGGIVCGEDNSMKIFGCWSLCHILFFIIQYVILLLYVSFVKISVICSV